MRVLISGGGTGGHVYPALAIAAALPNRSEVLYVGSEDGMEEDLLRQAGAGVAFAAIAAAPLRGRAPWTLVHNLAVLWKGTRQVARLLADFAPQVVLVTGGYVTVPVGIAARRWRVPLLVFLPDIVPGLAVRFLSHLASRVATTTPLSARYLPRGKVVVTGYPVRPAILQVERHQARERLGLPAEERVLLVYGGSRGARRINQAVAVGMQSLLEQGTIVHVCGQEGDEIWLRQRAAEVPAELQARYHLYPYLHDMPAALAAADLVICRAGASVLGELPARGLPAILVPYPYVHQHENADYLVSHGAAVKLSDDSLCGADGRPDATALLRALHSILETPGRYTQMAQAARRLARPNAAWAMAEELRSLAGETVGVTPRPYEGT